MFFVLFFAILKRNVIFNQVYYFHVHGPNVLVFGKPICVSQFYTSIFDIIVLFTVFDHMR